jgi:hypothetical protein
MLSRVVVARTFAVNGDIGRFSVRAIPLPLKL